MEILARDVVEKCLSTKRSGLYSDVLEKMEAGMALRFKPGEWKMRTPLNLYFFGKYNRGGAKMVSVRKVGADYLVIRL